MASERSSPTAPESGIGERRAKARARGNGRYRERREELIKAAGEEFIEKGYENTSIADIAARVGTDRATFYYYFEGKEQLFEFFEDVAAEVTEANLRAAESILSLGGTARERLKVLMTTFLESYVNNYPSIHLYVEEDLHKIGRQKEGRAPQILAQSKQIEVVFGQLFDQAVERGDFRSDVPSRIAVQGLFGMLNGTYQWLKPHGELEPRDVADLFLTIFVDGMAPRQRLS